MDGEYPDPELEDESGLATPDGEIKPKRAFLKRKTKAVKIEKNPKKEKPTSKSKIDCWQGKGDSSQGTVIYGNKQKPNRRSLLKKNQ